MTNVEYLLKSGKRKSSFHVEYNKVEAEKMEVIGNIYDNPELIEGENNG